MIHLDDCTKRAELDMKSNLFQLDEISRCLQRITPRDQSSDAPSADERSSHDESPRNPSFVNDSETIPKLKADMEYVSKELGQIRGDIEDVRAEV